MAPDRGQTLHLESSRVLLDGALVPARVRVSLDSRAVATVEEILPGPASPAGASGLVRSLGDTIVAPSPLDLHFHGAGGQVVPPVGDPREIDRAVSEAAAVMTDGTWGITTPYSWVATLPVPQQPPADPVAHVEAAARAIASAGPSGCVGMRLEGCFLNPARAGVWPPETFRAADADLLDQLVDAARAGGSPLLVIDVAPELPGAAELISRARARGVIVSLAHTDATWDQAVLGIDAGATMATHTWNAMRPLRHRDPGVVAASIVDPRVTCELICDGVHLHPGTVALTIAASRDRGGWVSISDASPFAGCEPGTYSWAGTTVTHDGTSLSDPGGNLAGSASLLDAAMPILASAGAEPAELVASLGATAWRLLDPARPAGLVAGDRAWLVRFPRERAPAVPPR